MKAMILAAGFGKRLLPFSENTPKALFPIAGYPLLDISIHSLKRAGCRAIIINTHHLHHKIETFIADQNYAIPVCTRYEPKLLGTGGSIKNVADFWDNYPFMVVNGDIVTDIDLRKVFDFHLHHKYPVTLVLHDDAELNSVATDRNGFVTGFERGVNEMSVDTDLLTFTGIQVLDPEVLNLIPDNTFSSSIDAYEKLISSGEKIKTYISKESYWKDIGTPERYKKTVFDKMAPAAIMRAFPGQSNDEITCTILKGDGSDRDWYRITSNDCSIVMADHGIRSQNTISEVDSFIAIGHHLENSGIHVPIIYLHDAFSGLVFLEDLGDTNLQDIVQNTSDLEEIKAYYKSIIELLVKMSVFGIKDFDPSWTYQSPSYNKNLIIEKECHYFRNAFLKEYLGINAAFENLECEFEILADRALEFSVEGFMHRDFQSRNIMVKNNRFYFIDFQGGRIGPIQYDLASLLIDPYVELPYPLQDYLLDYCVENLSSIKRIDPDKFRRSYIHCAITRNLQILGAFGYLTGIKKKSYFEKYIPAAVKTLKHNLTILEHTDFPGLKAVIDRL